MPPKFLSRHYPLLAPASNDPGSGGAPAPQPQPPAPNPPAPPAPAPQQTQPPGQMHIVPQRDFKKIKENAELKGRRAMEVELLQKFGVKSLADLEAKLKPAAPPAPPPGQPGSIPEGKPAAAKRLQKQIEQERAARAKAEKQKAELSQRLKAERAENMLRLAAARAGISDPEYALHLVKSHRRSLPPEEAEKPFDEAAFFEGLKKTHGFLFGPQVRPANTAAPTNAPAPAPTTNPPPTSTPEPTREQIMKMKPAEYKAFMRSRGFQT